MSFEIEVDFCPAYELVNSLNAYLSKQDRKSIDLGKRWYDEVSQTLTAEFKAYLGDLKPDMTKGLEHLIYSCPGKRSEQSFLKWMDDQSFQNIYDILQPYDTKILNTLKERIHDWEFVLKEWHKQYFSKIDSRILIGLEQKAAQIKNDSKLYSPEEVFEEVTNGMRQSPNDKLKTIRLIPQYHLSPINRSHYYQNYEEMFVCFFACDVIPLKAGEPSPRLMRKMRCLSEEMRMKLLYYMSVQERTFNELLNYSGLAKSTLHHHLVVLRGAGLISLEISEPNNKYFLRADAIHQLTAELGDFFLLQEASK
ncbi:DNA-binding transcriptional ArsR family regulator [Salirhabdus euzebyi]|uniref:DNA-binding transcriptional ArsR family regulator n=1 Tax=Salirhabdus euzebyi TaxID=394506 RepID=A0A841Q7I5_9BACI|nr:winged helix-turn-helix domain-containing protein [Salirhabdus euzebyi]MBB6454252.1 DNA-binding transcriptional ArsR family regulator [Salirhabdus euzebyi]